MATGKIVLVTGASSGIGRKLTERLAAVGCFVYAGARKNDDLRALAALANVRPLRLDVTDSQEIAKALQIVKGETPLLHGLVNNAGVVTLGAVLDGDDAEFELMMAVNVHGPYRITKAFAPLVVAAKGRIMMISSVAGILTEPNVSAYSMSKHAIEAFTDCLAEELEPLGVCVSVVEPGTFKTEIGKNACQRTGPNPLMPDFSKFPEPDEVISAIIRALFEPRPRRRYLVATNATQAQATIAKHITQLVQVNEGHRYSCDRNVLVRMLDDALAATRR